MTSGRHRKGNQFPDANVPGDPRLLDSLARRTPNMSGGSVTHVFGSTIITTPKRVRSSGSGSTQTPFKITLFKEDDEWKYKVSSIGSSVTDGTNGDSLAIDGLDGDGESISSSKYIVLQADVDEDLEVGDFTVTAVDAADLDEVGFDNEDPPQQDTIRVLVGKITFEGEEEEGEGGEEEEEEEIDDSEKKATKTQALFSCVRITHGIVDGIACRVADMSPAHPDIL